MTKPKRVILIGLDPAVVHYDKWPGLTPEKLEAGLRRDEAALRDRGLDAEICFVRGDTADATVAAALAETSPDVVLIGAGVRNDPDQFLLFERLVNIVHTGAPQARLCFNTGPTDNVDAVARWV